MAPKQQSDKGKQPAPVPLVRLCQAERLADYQMSLLRNISPSAIQQYIAQALEGTKKPTNGCGSIRLVQGSLQTTIASTRDSAGGWSDECPVNLTYGRCLKGGTNHQGNGIQIELDGIYSLDQRKDWQYSPRLPLFPRQGVAPIGATQTPSSQCGKIPARTKVGTPFDLQTASVSLLRGRRIIHKPKGHNDKVVAWNFRNIIHKSKSHNYKIMAWKFMGTPRIKYTKDQKYTWQLTASSPLTRMAEAGVIEWLIARLHEKNAQELGPILSFNELSAAGKPNLAHDGQTTGPGGFLSFG
ncbi:hypothetical protein TESG_08198 [Trichophyton tonsurans CBS 112818]|uniref:Uncharacterized protein n=1 Tax=Trichophyton tonsurans (strain CBS 112818) TaxID=647933 RepID=F2SBG0_TRIT1|nr:hypothetical protein TESG_08198 [Trichophyton tonsurans CBS 112818]